MLLDDSGRSLLSQRPRSPTDSDYPCLSPSAVTLQRSAEAQTQSPISHSLLRSASPTRHGGFQRPPLLDDRNPEMERQADQPTHRGPHHNLGFEGFCCPHEEAWSLQCRSVCGKAQHTIEEVLQLPPGSCSRSYRCPSTNMESADPIHLPTICSDWPSSPKVTAGSSSSGSSDCPDVALPNMVSSATGKSDGLPNPVTSESVPSDQPQGRDSPADRSEQSSTSRLESFRQGVSCQDISDEAFELLCAAWRKGTEKSYATVWNHWSSWFNQREINSLAPTLGQVLEILDV